MPYKRCYAFLLTILILVSLAGCGRVQSADIDPTPEVTATPTPEPTPVPTPEQPSAPLSVGAPAELSDGYATTYLSGSFTFRNEQQPVGALYLMWRRIPQQFSIVVDGQPLEVEHQGFLNQFIQLDTPATEVVVQSETALCDVFAFAPNAHIPDWVQIWEPPLEQADLLLFPTHADDEHVFFGGMMPYYAGEKGYRVQVVYLTNHWDQLRRPQEQLAGLWAVGIRNYPVIGDFTDHYANSLAKAYSLYSKDAVVTFLVEQIRRFRPSVIVGHDLKGEYGHGVHVMNAVCLTEAVDYAADPTAFSDSAERYGAWNTPKLYLHLYPEREIIMDWDVPLTAFGGKTAFEMAETGFALHETQQGFFHVYRAGEAWDSRRFGLYRSTVGPDVIGGDVFENIENKQ